MWATTDLPTFINKFVDFMKELPKKMLNIGKDIVRGIWDGIVAMGDWLADKISDFTEGIVDGIKDSLEINSPSKVLADEVGKYMAQGIGVGFESEMGSVSTNMAKAMPINKQDYTDNINSNASKSTSGGNGDIIQNVVINSPTALSPSETARINKRALQELALEF
jgi:hypothetical protein